MHSISNRSPTIFQVTANPTTAHTVIQQNGQHILLSRLETTANQILSAGDVGGLSSEVRVSTSQGPSIFSNHYLKTTTEENQYANADRDNQLQYQEYTPIIYTSVCGAQSYYQSLNSQVISDQIFHPRGIVVGSNAQFLTHQGATYLFQTGPNIEEDPIALSHNTKASPLTVQWLVENYETAEGISLPRSTLYFHYLQHCHEKKLEPMNPASFGKLIRSIFLGLRTRRLGTRGNSKYHYYGIRIKPASLLQRCPDETEAVSKWRALNLLPPASGHLTASQQRSAPQPTHALPKGSREQFRLETSSALPNLDEICRSVGLPVPGVEQDFFPGISQSPPESPSLLPPSSEGRIVDDSSMEAIIGDTSKSDLVTFVCLYAHSAGSMLEAVVNLDFATIARVWKAFWRTDSFQGDSEVESLLPRERLYVLLKSELVQQFIRLYDHTFYQSLAEVLIPNVLRPISPSLTQAIRNLAKSLEAWMKVALQSLDPFLVRIKMSAVSALAQTLRRYTSLNHLAQAARAVLKNTAQTTQMLLDLNRVDFNNVQEQASWVCQCSDATVSELEANFKCILQKQSSLEEWAQWLDTVVTNSLRPLEGNSLAYTRVAHQLILKWSFYSSMVIRDLTLRSAASFGSFHLIRLLYDEYIFYLVEHKVAANLSMTPVAVMGEMGRVITRPQREYSLRRRDCKMRAHIEEEETLTVSSFSLETVDIASNGHAEDEEIDEYLEGEEEDCTGAETVMLSRAHAVSARAFCRGEATADSMPSPQADSSPPLQENAASPGAAPTPTPVCPNGDLSEPEAPAGKPVSSPEDWPSQPPIVTFAVPSRKVVRVTFDENQHRASPQAPVPRDVITGLPGLSLSSSSSMPKRLRLS